MSARIVPFDYESQPVRFNGDGWLHATEIAARFGREPRDWLRLHETEGYMRALASHLGIPFEPNFSARKASQKVTGGKSDSRPELSSCAGLVAVKRGAPATGGGTWLHPKLAVAFARWLNVDFAVWCDLRIEDLLHGGGQNWNSARREASLGYRGLCDALALNCEAQGKTPQRHHFINEARLINEVITGTFAGRDRDRLTAHELEIVTLVELRDSVLIGQGLAYGDRKTNLLQYVQQLLGKRIGSDAA
ncbi:DNA-binding protein [Pseudomonas sp. YY-1]|uniref:KilA-N domain-containing protein n=1 Tax=Pseudomonas sp. YY-1 TaxID=2058659 RepID=UPI000CB8A814|nr:KilA-N domain-containing protein [Pseudomonas sp. YY-1]PKQ41128.1 DNA-binding protein [Pseudomonas sp. YY-1]